jgi:hypothetical protein
MKSALRWGAVCVLLLMAGPFLRFLGDPRLVAFLVWGVAYLAFQSIFPAAKQAIVAPLAVSVGLLSLQLLAVISMWGRDPITPVEVALVAAAIVWLFVRPGRIPATALITDHAINVCAVALMIIQGGSAATVWWFMAMIIVMRVLAIYLITELVWGGGRKAAQPVA